jgi:lysophospholipase L1-like esterase
MFMIRIASGATINNLTFKPMLSEGTEVIPYEPYRERTQALTSETINGEVLTDRTITADKIIANSITSNEIDVAQLFADEAAIRTLIAQTLFTDAIETNRVVVGKANRDEIIVDNLFPYPYVKYYNLQGDVEWVVDDDGIITANGTSTAASALYISNDFTLEPGTYTVSGCPNGGSSSKYRIQLANSDWSVNVNDYGNGATFTLTEKTTFTTARCYIASGVVANNLIFKPMLVKGTEIFPFYPHRLSKQGLIEQMKVDNLFDVNSRCSKTTNGVTGSVLANGNGLLNGTIAANGTVMTAGKATYIDISGLEVGESITISARVINGIYTQSTSSTASFYFDVRTVDGTNLTDTTIKGGTVLHLTNHYGKVTYTMTQERKDAGAYYIYPQIWAYKDDVFDNLEIQIMIEKGETAHIYTEYSKGGTGLANNIYYQGTTLIDGGNIYTGTVTADTIDVDDLFAQDITATGSITGATLVSLENNSSKVVIDKGEVAIYDFDTRGEGGFYKVGSVFASGGGMVSASGAWIFESLSTELGNDVDEMAARLNKITQRNFILIGDSYLAGQTPDGDIDSWGVYLKNLLPEYSFSIHAIKGSGFGSTVSGKNFLDALKQYTGDKSIITDIIVCGGYNDAATSITTSAVLTGIANFISYVNQNFLNAKIHIGYIGATNNGKVLERIKEAIRIYRASGSKGCGYISNMEYTLKNTQFFTSDGVHPNQIGQKNIAWNLASYLTTGNVSVIQEKEDCEVIAPSTVTAGITLYTGLNNEIVSLYHPTNEYLKFSGLSATKMNGAEGSRVTLGTLTNSSIIGNQTTSSVATSTANASVSIPINVKTASGWYTGIGTLEIISLNVVLRLNIMKNSAYLNEVVTGIIIPSFTATFDSLDV